MKIIPPTFLQVPYAVHKECTPSESAVYATVYWFHSLKDGKCMASNKAIAEISRVKRVDNALSKLEKLGFIRRTYKDGDKKVRDRIIPLVEYKQVSSDKVSRVEDTVSSTEEGVSSTEDTGYPPQRNRIRKINKKRNKKRKESVTTPQKYDSGEDLVVKKTTEFIEDVRLRLEGIVLTRSQANEIQKFVSYWTEPNKSKTRLKWEMEKTWDTKRRISRWMKNSIEWGNNQRKGKNYDEE